MSEKPKLYCYLRVSTQQQLEEGHSIENQRFLGKKVSKNLGMTYVELNEGGAAVISVTNVDNGDGNSDLSQGQALQQMLGFQRGRLDFAGAEQTLREEGSITGG